MRLPVILSALLLLGNAHAQNAPAGLNEDFSRALTAGFHYSLSRQFVVHSEPRTGWFPSVGNATNLVRLEPDLLAISCERIKRGLLNELGVAKDQWRGTIHVNIHPARALNETIQIASVLYPSGWSYQLDVPDAIERSRLLDAVIQVLLLEMANRNATRRTAEIPAWLAHGLAQQVVLDTASGLVTVADVVMGRIDYQQLMVQAESDLVLQTPNRKSEGASIYTVRSGTRVDPLAKAHDELSKEAPLTLEELSWPEDDQLVGEAGHAFRNSAQLLVRDLAAMPDGQACLREFIDQLSQHYNWQLAFLNAFHSHFGTQRDVEKWWALKLEAFTKRDLAQMWSGDDSWRKLNELIRPPVQVRTKANDMPLRAQVSLQTIIQEWDFVNQTKVLQEKDQQLFLLRSRVCQALVPLVDGYRRAIENYFKNRARLMVPRLVTPRHIEDLPTQPQLEQVLHKAVRELDELDARFQEFRPNEEPPGSEKSATASTLPSH
jgi:hypothetical protein